MKPPERYARLRRLFRAAADVPFLRFLVIGGINTAFAYLVYAGLLLAGLHFAAANLGALVLGVLFSFKTQGVLVFRDPRNRLFARYVGAWLLIYCVQVSLIGILINMGLNAYVAGLAVLPVIVPTSYFVQRLLIFRQPRQQGVKADAANRWGETPRNAP